jgi:hypothetical protein
VEAVEKEISSKTLCHWVNEYNLAVSSGLRLSASFSLMAYVIDDGLAREQ